MKTKYWIKYKLRTSEECPAILQADLEEVRSTFLTTCNLEESLMEFEDESVRRRVWYSHVELLSIVPLPEICND